MQLQTSTPISDEIVFVNDRTYGFRRVGTCMMVAMPAREFVDSEYEKFSDALLDDLQRRGGFQYILNFTPATAPNAKLRKMQTQPKYAPMSQAVNEVQRGLIISDSLAIRGAITALKWLKIGPKSHDVVSVANFKKGLDWLCAGDPPLRQAVETGLVELVTATGHPPLPS